MTRITPGVFGASGIVPVGYAAFAFVLGVTAGALVRRTVPAMAITLAVFAAVQIAMPTWVRPHLIAPVRSVAPLNVAAAGIAVSDVNARMTLYPAVSTPGGCFRRVCRLC